MARKLLDIPRRYRRSAALLVGAVLAAVLAAMAVWLAAARVEQSGLGFETTGRRAAARVASLAGALEERDPEAFAAAFTADFSGYDPGLTRLAPVSRRGGVAIDRFSPPGVELDRPGMVEAWWRYLAGFAAVEGVTFHLLRLESWGLEPVAVARFELIGRPHGAPRSGVDRATFRARFAPSGEGLRIRSLELLDGERTLAARPQFSEVGERAGIAFENRYYPPFLSRPLAFRMIRFGPAGITAADYDGDGLADLFVPDGVASRLFRNRGDGTFEDVTAAAGLAGLSGVSVALFADYDNDGSQDLFVSRTFEPNQLFHGNGDGTFTEVTARSGLAADACTTVASWADVDNDGDLDLFVGRYIDPRKAIPTTFYARNGEPDRLYRNDGDGTFTDVTARAGVGDTGLCLGSSFADFNDDGWPDLYLANDFGRNTLYRNRGGDGGGIRFADATVESGTLDYGAGMSSSPGDYDNDGRLDLYVANIRSHDAWYAEAPTVRRYVLNTFRQGLWRRAMPLFLEIFRQSGPDLVRVFQQMSSGNTLFHNRGDGTFGDATWTAGVNPPGWFWGTSFGDFDNDGWLDLYAADGWVYGARGTDLELDFLSSVVSRQDLYRRGVLFDPEHFAGRSWHGWERNRHLRNNGDGTFSEIGRAAGTDLVRNSRGVAVADFWNRGVLDIAVAASADRHALLANLGTSRGHWLEVEVVGRVGELPLGTNRDGVGVRVSVVAGGLGQFREVTLGDGYGSQNSLRQHFGLGDAARVDELTVRWPRSGRVETFRDVEADRIVRVVEGRGELEVPPYPSAAALPAPARPPEGAGSVR